MQAAADGDGDAASAVVTAAAHTISMDKLLPLFAAAAATLRLLQQYAHIVSARRRWL